MAAKQVLVIFAHPDDPDFACSGTMARWADEGAEITYCIITNGAAGSNDPSQDLKELIAIREREQRAAAAVTGVKDVIFLGYQDGILEPTIALRRELTRIIRQIKPHVVVCGDPLEYFYGDEYLNHADHRAAGEAALTAVFPSAPTRPIFPDLIAEGYEPHQVSQVWVSMSATMTEYVDISATLDRKVAAVKCHVSQIGTEWDVAAEMARWAEETGKTANMPYAEGFRVMRLVKDPVDVPPVHGES